jgi:hypothetical protein
MPSSNPLVPMPRACPVVFTRAATNPHRDLECHGLVPWNVTFVAMRARPGEERNHPRHKAVAFGISSAVPVAANVSVHRASRWHCKAHGIGKIRPAINPTREGLHCRTEACMNDLPPREVPDDCLTVRRARIQQLTVAGKFIAETLPWCPRSAPSCLPVVVDNNRISPCISRNFCLPLACRTQLPPPHTSVFPSIAKATLVTTET